MTAWPRPSQPSSRAFFGSFAKWVVGYVIAWYLLDAVWSGDRFDLRRAVFVGVFVGLAEAAWRYRQTSWREVVDPAQVLGMAGAAVVLLIGQLVLLPEPAEGWELLRIFTFALILSLPGYLMVASLRELRRRREVGH